MALDQYTYVFAIGTLFALLDAFNNGASEWPSVFFLVDDFQTARPPACLPPLQEQGSEHPVDPIGILT